MPVYAPGVSTPAEGQAVTLRATASHTSFAMATGVGIDIKINRHLSFRPVGLDYFLTRLQNFRPAQDKPTQPPLHRRLQLTFGGEAPAPPPPARRAPTTHASLLGWQSGSRGADCPKRSMDLRPPGGVELCPGTTLNITPPGPIPDGASYQWSIDGEPVSKQASFEFGTTGRESRAYKLGLTVSAPEYNDTTLERIVTIGAYQPPSGAIEASPREIWAGEKASLSANFNPGHCGGELGSPVFTASEGSISGNQFDSSEVQFDPGSTSEQRKTITVAARVADGKGEGTAQAALVVKKPAATLPRRLPDIIFPTASARVNNCGKRVLLEELRGLTDGDPNGKVVFVDT